MNLEVGPYQLIVPRIVQTLGAGMLWVPGNTAAYMYIPRDQTSNASGLFNLIRNEGSSIGVSVVTTLLVRNSQAHQNIFGVAHQSAESDGDSGVAADVGGRAARTGDPVLAQKMGLAMVYAQVQRQAMALSYFDMFRLFALRQLHGDPDGSADETLRGRKRSDGSTLVVSGQWPVARTRGSTELAEVKRPTCPRSNH